MAEGPGSYQPLLRRDGYAVCPCDGFTTTMIRTGEEATVQISYWIFDGSPDAENMGVPYEDPTHYQISAKHSLQTAVKLKPDVAHQMALNLLQTLDDLPEEVKARYGIPSKLISD